MNVTGESDGAWVDVLRCNVMRAQAHTIAEWLAEPEDRRLELIDGAFVEKAAPDVSHGFSQMGLIRALSTPFHRPAGHGGAPGGWWIAPEIDIQLGNDGFRPDVSGWRRDRVASLPRVRPVALVPDWICEVLSESNRAHDTVRKLRLYHRGGVGHYWLLDPTGGTLTVFRHEPQGFFNVLSAERHEVVSAPPFEVIDLRIAELLGDDPR